MSLDASDYGVGGRGGPKPPNTVDSARTLYDDWYPNEQQMLRETILRRCIRQGEVHADDVDHLPITKANGIGIAFNTLQKRYLIRPTVLRASRRPARHKAKSFVYVLTERGRLEAELLL